MREFPESNRRSSTRLAAALAAAAAILACASQPSPPVKADVVAGAKSIWYRAARAIDSRPALLPEASFERDCAEESEEGSQECRPFDGVGLFQGFASIASSHLHPTSPLDDSSFDRRTPPLRC